MTKVYSLKVEPMTDESFEPFGQLIDPRERPPDQRMILPLDFHAEGRTTLSSIWQPCEGLTFWEMERHFGVTQTFFQLSGSPIIVAAAAPTDADPMSIPEPEQIRAFLIDPSKGYSFKVGEGLPIRRTPPAPVNLPSSTMIRLDPIPWWPRTSLGTALPQHSWCPRLWWQNRPSWPCSPLQSKPDSLYCIPSPDFNPTPR